MEKMTVHINAFAKDETVLLRIETPQETISKKFTFAELMNPSFILQSLGGPLAMMLLPQLIPGSQTNIAELPKLDINWRCYYDNLAVGKSTLRVYRIEAKLPGGFQVAATISKAGEILKIELPDNIVLLNEALVSL